MKKRTMFCLPFAGGTKAIFNEFKEELNQDFDVVPLEYSGHGTRFSSPLITDITRMVEDICVQIRATCCRNYILLGHSLGTAIAYEVACKMTNIYGNPPQTLVLMAQKPPHLQWEDTRYKGKSRNEIMQDIYKLGHMSDEILRNGELYNIYSEIIFADITILNGYKPDIKKDTLAIPFILFTGKEDESATKEEMLQWKRYSQKDSVLFEIDGGHFFPFENQGEFFQKLHKAFESKSNLALANV